MEDALSILMEMPEFNNSVALNPPCATIGPPLGHSPVVRQSSGPELTHIPKTPNRTSPNVFTGTTHTERETTDPGFPSIPRSVSKPSPLGTTAQVQEKSPRELVAMRYVGNRNERRRRFNKSRFNTPVCSPRDGHVSPVPWAVQPTPVEMVNPRMTPLEKPGHTGGGEDRLSREVIEKMVTKEVEKCYQQEIRREDTKHETVTQSEFRHIRRPVTLERRADFLYKIKTLKEYGIATRDEIEKESDRRIEMEYWRMNTALRQREMTVHFETMICVGVDTMETILNVLNFKGLLLTGIGSRMRGAIKDGKFHAPVRYYTEMSTTPGKENMFTHPMTAFLIAFGSLVFQNHLIEKGKANDREHSKATHKSTKRRRGTTNKQMSYRLSDGSPSGRRSRQWGHSNMAPSPVYARPTPADRPSENTYISSSSEYETDSNVFSKLIPSLVDLGTQATEIANIETERKMLNTQHTNCAQSL